MSAVITAITDVFTAIGSWIVSFIPSLIDIFYVAGTGLTFLGTLAVCGLAISVFFLIMSIIQNFLHFRG